MKITKSQLKQIIKEEMGTLVPEPDVSEEALVSINTALNNGDIVFAEKLAGRNPDAIAVIDQWKEQARRAHAAEREAPPTPEDEVPEPYHAIAPQATRRPGIVSELQLKQFIKEEIEYALDEIETDIKEPETDQDESPAIGDKQKLTTTSKGAASFAKAGKEDRKGANPELSNYERGIIQQIDDFLLKLAQVPGVELQMKKPIIQKVMNILQKRVVPSAEVKNDG